MLSFPRSKEVLDFFKNISIFLVLVTAMDFSLGWVVGKLYFSQESGRHHRITTTIDKTASEMIVFGSSTASLHYVPQEFEKITGHSFYNSGVRGQGILFANTLQRLLLKRHKPKVIILNIDATYLFERDDIYQRLAAFLPYYKDHKEILAPIVRLKDPYEEVKLLSNLYPYNSKLLHIIKYAIKPQPDHQGYLPYYGKWDKKVITSEVAFRPIDNRFKEAFKSFLVSAIENNIKLFLVVSPTSVENDKSPNKSFQKMLEISQTYEVPLLNYSNDPDFMYQYELWKDQVHLNHQGAQLFSRKLAFKINQMLSPEIDYQTTPLADDEQSIMKVVDSR
jgi:lysophospholipase L1-like esterase